MTNTQPATALRGVTDGIAWAVESDRDAQGMGWTRWHSEAAYLPGAFLLLFQTTPGGARQDSDLLGPIATLAYRRFLDQYDLDPTELPGWDRAQAIDPPPAPLADSFVTRTNAPAAAAAWLTPERVTALARWASDAPLRAFVPMGDDNHYLIVLVSPRQLSLLASPAIEDRARLDALARLGVGLARSAGGHAPADSAEPTQRSCPSCAGPAMRLDSDGSYECRYCGSRFAAPKQAAPVSGRPRSSVLPENLSKAALTSLIAGVVAWTIIPVGGALVAVVAGVKAIRETRASGGAITGGWLGVIGLLLGASQILLGLLFIGLFILAAIFGSSG